VCDVIGLVQGQQFAVHSISFLDRVLGDGRPASDRGVRAKFPGALHHSFHGGVFRLPRLSHLHLRSVSQAGRYHASSACTHWRGQRERAATLSLCSTVAAKYHQQLCIRRRLRLSSCVSCYLVYSCTLYFPSFYPIVQLHAVWSALAWYCPSVCLSVTLCIVVLMVDVGGLKLYRRVPSTALPISFFKHFCYRIYAV